MDRQYVCQSVCLSVCLEIVNDDICKSNGEDVLHQHFIVENCGEAIRLRAQLPAMNVFYFVKMHCHMFLTSYTALISDHQDSVASSEAMNLFYLTD